MELFEFITYLVMLVLAIALLGLIIWGAVLFATVVVAFVGGLVDELKKYILERTE